MRIMNMRMTDMRMTNKICRGVMLVVVALISFGTATGQPAVIKGTAPGAERRMLRVMTQGDLVTQWELPVAAVRIDSTGHFSVSVPLEHTINIVVSIDFHKAELLLEPGKTYNVKIEPLAYDEYQEINPFIQSQGLTMTQVDPDPNELNMVVGSFNTLYSGFLMEHFNALYKERRKSLIDTFRVQVNSHFGSVKNPYFIEYAKYKVAGLEQLTQYYSRGQLAKRYFTDQPVLYNNLEYMELFNGFFAKYLISGSSAVRKLDIPSLLRGSDPYRGMMKALAADTILRGDQLRELVMLKGCMELYGIPTYPDKEILALIKSVQERSTFPENRIVAEDITLMLTRLTPGTKAPGFTLMARDQKEMSLASMAGKPVLLNFWTTYCEGCLSEMDLIKPLYDKYGENIRFVSISADKFFSKMLYFINLKPDYVWTFLNVGDQSDVLREYDVRTYPLFVLLDRNGNIFRYPAAMPSEGLEAELQSVIAK